MPRAASLPSASAHTTSDWPRDMSPAASPPRNVIVPWITAQAWDITSSEFNVIADIGRVLQRHGAGVYTVILWADIGGLSAPVSEYSIFYEIDPPRIP